MQKESQETNKIPEQKITDRTKELVSINRILRILSKSERAILRAKDKTELMTAVCRIIVDIGGYPLAWVGFVRQNEARTVLPVAYAGEKSDAGENNLSHSRSPDWEQERRTDFIKDGFFETQDSEAQEHTYLNSLHLTWANAERGRGPTGKAIRSGKPLIIEDIQTDPDFEPWRDAALSLGYKSTIALPLTMDKKVFGVLRIYSKKPYGFHPEEAELFTELAADMAYGIMTLRAQEERVQVQENIRKLNEELEQQVLDKTAELASVNKKLHNAKTAAEAANQAKNHFLANMSHEIRTPLNAITGFIHLMMETRLTSEQWNYLEKIRISAKSLLSIINDILDFSKVEAGNIELEKTDFQVQKILDELADLFAGRAAEKNIEMIIDTTSDVPPVLIGDPLRLKQILINLTGNAVKFTPAGEIQIHAACVEETERTSIIRFTVKDTGIGMSSENIKNIFSAFSQIDDSVTRKYSGAGLGLAISKQLTELMGGRIEVYSEPDKGSTFEVTIPFERSALLSASDPKTRKQMSKICMGGMKVLIADDNASFRRVLVNMMNTFECDIISVESGEQAFKTLKSEASEGSPFHVIMLDWRMPGIDGIALSEKIRKDSQIAHTPIIMISGFITDEEMKQGIRIGINKFLIKPVKLSVLANALKDVLGIQPADNTDTDVPAQRVETEFKSKVSHSQAGAWEREIESPTWEREKTHNLSGLKILVTEDNKINQEFMISLLEKEGIAVDIAQNGKQAVEAVKNNVYDAVIMDVEMPEMDGYTATRLIRDYEAGCSSTKHSALRPQHSDLSTQTSALPIIAMTAHAMQGDREKALEAGMNDYISKPIDPYHLFEILGKWAGRRGQDSEISTPRSHMLRDFVVSFGNAVETIKYSLASGDTDKAQQLAHSLKGAAGRVSAEKLHTAAEELELLLRKINTGDLIVYSEINAKVDKIAACLEQIIKLNDG